LVLADGSAYGAKPLARGALYLMLSNRLYRGEIVHKREAYPGEHAAIIELELWNDVQAILADNRITRDHGYHAAAPSLLAGLIFDAAGERLTPSHAVKRGTRYRYYVSQSLIAAGSTKDKTSSPTETGWRIPAAALEGLVRTKLIGFLGSSAEIMDALGDIVHDALQHQRLARAAAMYGHHLQNQGDEGLRRLLTATAARIDVHPDRVDLALDGGRLIDVLRIIAMRHRPGREKREPPARHRSTAMTASSCPFLPLCSGRARIAVCDRWRSPKTRSGSGAVAHPCPGSCDPRSLVQRGRVDH
jgi:hypothetical protein